MACRQLALCQTPVCWACTANISHFKARHSCRSTAANKNNTKAPAGAGTHRSCSTTGLRAGLPQQGCARARHPKHTLGGCLCCSMMSHSAAAHDSTMHEGSQCKAASIRSRTPLHTGLQRAPLLALEGTESVGKCSPPSCCQRPVLLSRHQQSHKLTGLQASLLQTLEGQASAVKCIPLNCRLSCCQTLDRNGSQIDAYQAASLSAEALVSVPGGAGAAERAGRPHQLTSSGAGRPLSCQGPAQEHGWRLHLENGCMHARAKALLEHRVWPMHRWCHCIAMEGANALLAP